MLIWFALAVLIAQAPTGLSAGNFSAARTGTGTGPSVRITSPLGRSGVPGSIRIVAQIQSEAGAALGPVRFFIDGQLFRTDEDGAPYVVEWTDENPFERREIAVAVSDALGREVRDSVVLEPFEIVEETDVTSVMVEASVQDKNGRFVKALPQSAFNVLEDGVAQVIDLARHEAVGATLALLIDSSSSMSRRLDFVQRTAATLTQYMTPLDRMVIAPFSKGLLPTTGPTDDKKTVSDAIAAIRSSGGTAILDSLRQIAGSFPESTGRRAVILITDGYDENSTSPVEETLDALKEAKATVYVVAIGGVAGISLKGEKVLRLIAAETGGRVFMPTTEGQLELVHNALADDVQNRYLITYTPANQAHDGRWRDISVVTGVPEYRVKARPGYFAPKPAPVRPSLEFTATDLTGKYLEVAADDLEIMEDGVPQKVDTFHEASQPVSIVLALDASGSMRHKEADVIASAHAFTNALRPQDQLGVMMFSDSVVLAQDLSANRDAAKAAINDYKTSGGTALYDALGEAMARLKRVEGRRVVVVLSDGRDEDNPGTGPGSVRKLSDVLDALKQTGAVIFPIGLGTKVDAPMLEKLADLSGGRALMPQDVSTLGDEFQRVVEDLRRRYVVGYTSTNGERNGKWRDVEIHVKAERQITVRSLGGYNAPER